MTYTSRLFDAHKTVIESFIIEQAGVAEFKGIKYAPKLSEAKIKYALLEKVMELIGTDLDVDAVTEKLEAEKARQAAEFLAEQELRKANQAAILEAANRNHIPEDEMIVDELVEV